MSDIDPFTISISDEQINDLKNRIAHTRWPDAETTNDWKDDALNLIARMPRLMGLIFRIREGREENIPADDTSLSMVERFIRCLDLHDANTEKESERS